MNFCTAVFLPEDGFPLIFIDFFFFFFFFNSFVQIQEGLQQVKPGFASQVVLQVSQGWERRLESLLLPVMRAWGAAMGLQERCG